MSAFITKQLLVEAFKWTGGPDQEEDPLWIISAIKDGRAEVVNDPIEGFWLSLLDASYDEKARVYPGNWVVRKPTHDGRYELVSLSDAAIKFYYAQIAPDEGRDK